MQQWRWRPYLLLLLLLAIIPHPEVAVTGGNWLLLTCHPPPRKYPSVAVAVIVYQSVALAAMVENQPPPIFRLLPHNPLIFQGGQVLEL